MKTYSLTFRKRVLQVLVISLVAFSMDRLIVLLLELEHQHPKVDQTLRLDLVIEVVNVEVMLVEGHAVHVGFIGNLLHGYLVQFFFREQLCLH